MSKANMNSRITGPTPLPDEVRKAIERPMISHRSREFKETFGDVQNKLKDLFGSSVAPLLFTSSGTAALESTILNLLGPDDKVLALSIGYYGDLYASMAQCYLRENVDVIRLPDGDVFTEEYLNELMKKKQYTAVLITHNESSTGATQPLEELCRIIRSKSDALILVDAVSSIGCMQFNQEAWGIDAAVSVSQKGLMAPPGFSVVSVSKKALKVNSRKKVFGSVAFNYSDCYEKAKSNDCMTTPSLHAYWGIEAALKLIYLEGLENVYRRHTELSETTIAMGEALGLVPLVQPLFRSPALSALLLPSEVSAEKILTIMESDFNVAIGRGVGKLSNKLLRVGHMGNASEVELKSCMEALNEAIRIIRD